MTADGRRYHYLVTRNDCSGRGPGCCWRILVDGWFLTPPPWTCDLNANDYPDIRPLHRPPYTPGFLHHSCCSTAADCPHLPRPVAVLTFGFQRGDQFTRRHGVGGEFLDVTHTAVLEYNAQANDLGDDERLFRLT